ncbi:hypothetical protein T484DRAFT_1823832 [Baffinella frigidus]|nr:hypothetical protein T484DRAFT_1823832 [Cryptophyta sp. CCMP2293]
MQGFCFVLLSSLAVTQAFLPAFPLSTGQRPRVASRAQSISQRGGGVAVRSAQGRSVVRMAEGDGKGDGEKDGEEKDEVGVQFKMF